MKSKDEKAAICKGLGLTFSIWGLQHTVTTHHWTEMITLTLNNRLGAYHFDIAFGPTDEIQIFHAMDLIYAGQYDEEHTAPIFSAIQRVLYP